MITFRPIAPLVLAIAATAACTQKDEIGTNTEPFDGIGAGEAITLVGTEPFWNIEIVGENASYSSPENLNGEAFAVSRFAGNNGLGFTGELNGEPITITVTPGECSDQMSDRDYPFVSTVAWGDRLLNGCGYTDAQPFTGDEAP